MRIAVAGGDLRMLTVCRMLAERGYDCTLFGFGNITGSSDSEFSAAVGGASAVILPLPFSKGGNLYAPFCEKTVSAEEALALCGNKTLILGGGIGKKGNNAVDYSLCEEFLIRNALITAEAALSIAMNETETTLFGSETVIIGYGRIGSLLAGMCRALGANVTVIARRPEARALAEASGVHASGFDGIEAPLSGADIVFNTVPSPVLGKNELAALKEGVLLVELASLPGGIDRAEAEKRRIRVIEALGLPGRYAPVSAGKAIAETVLPILRERGITP